MLEQLLMVEQAHKQALCKLDDEKKNHGEFMKKSDEFTNLLEQERERSVPRAKALRKNLILVSGGMFRCRTLFLIEMLTLDALQMHENKWPPETVSSRK